MAEGSTSGTQGECLIHCSDDNSNLVAPANIESWNTLLRAAEIIAYQPILDLAKDLPEGRIPSILYHRKCRSIFTMKKRLDKILAKETSADKSVTEDTRRSTREAPTTSRVYEVRCIFCNKCSKYWKGQRTKECLTQCVELRADDKIRRAAARKGDKRVLAIASRDLVAAEGHYHRSCYRAYTKEDSDIDRDETNLDQAESPYEAAERVALQKVFAYIREKVIENPKVVPFTDLTSTLVTQMSEYGVTELKHSTKTNLRRKIEAAFGKSLHIIPNEKGKLLVYPESLKMEQLVKWYQELKDELEVYRRAHIDEDTITKAARKDIQNHDVVQAWPPHVPDLEMNIICSSLADFFGTVLTGSSSEVQQTQRVKRLSTSFSQDLVYAVTNGNVKPAKHIVLPFAVRSLTGNVELIQILNRLGHSVAYSQVEEIDTALCLQKQAFSGDAIPLPQNIQLGRFTTLAWDSSSLPPCRDCLSLHVQRANYQAGVWRQCLEGQPDIPEPEGHGWTTNDEGILILDWLQGPPAPLAVLELLACKCIRTCKLPDCTCLSNKLKCTELCRLQTCSNQMEEEVVEDNINVVLDIYDDNDD